MNRFILILVWMYHEVKIVWKVKMDEGKKYKHKLNMLEPGSRMLKWIGILILAGILLYVFRFSAAAFCVWVVSGIVFAVLLILLAIEAHQDNVMNEIAMQENKKNGEI